MKPFSPVLTLNPELQRNLWLEFSVGRVIGMPLAIALLAGIVDRLFGADAVYGMLITIIWLLAILWGGRLAAETIGDEVAGRTWDVQRLSAQSATSLILGKFIGSTIYVWYGVFICVAAIAVTTPDHIKDMPDKIMEGLMAQSATMLTALIFNRFTAGEGRKRLGILAAQAIGITVTGFYSVLLDQARNNLPVLGFLHPDDDQKIQWFGFHISILGFVHGFEILTFGWILVGMVRLMRGELGFRDGPLVWAAFALFTVGVASGFQNSLGFDPDGNALSLMAPFVVAFGVTYLAVLGLPVSVAGSRKLFVRLNARAWPAVWRSTPPWIVSVILTLGVGFFCSQAGVDRAVMVVLTLGFLCRDIIVVYALRTRLLRRSELALFVYFALGYAVLPFFLRYADAPATLRAFTPFGPMAPDGTAILPWAEALVFYALFRKDIASLYRPVHAEKR